MLRTLLPAASLIFLSAGADRLAFAPEAELQLTKHFHVSIFNELDELSILAGGMDMTDMLGDFELSIGVNTDVEVTDTYLESAGGRPLKLKRSYDEIGIETVLEYVSEFDSDDQSETTESDLEGETIVFTWVPEDGKYDVDFDTEEGDILLLDGLLEDMDLRALLPPREVALDDEWNVDPKRLAPILAPGGSLGLFGKEMDEEAAKLFETVMGTDFDGLLDSMFAGEVVCTYKGTRDDDAGEIATVEIRIEIDSTTDLSEMLIDLVESLADDVPDDFSLSTADLGISMEGTALLEWNVTGGHFHHFESNVDTGVTFRLIAAAEGESVDVSVGLSGDVEIGADAER